MWTRRQLKETARGKIIKNYWNCIAVCLMMSIVFGRYPVNVETLRIFHSAANKLEIESVKDVPQFVRENSIKEKESRRKIEALATHAGAVLISVMISAGSFICIAVRMFCNMEKDGKSLEMVLVSVTIASILFTFLIVNMMLIGECRFYLENRKYRQTQMFRVFFLFRYGILKNPMWVMFQYTGLIILWSFTIVGGIWKAYEYRMVPFLLAENPRMSSKEVFALSKQMMKGQKWDCFLLDFSFLGWSILALCTLGATAIFWSLSYHLAVKAELYIVLRQKAIDEKMKYWECCNDVYLLDEVSA